ncbi:MAG: hypothetical protein GC157_11615 [Frankiales bacterium]|nr:hypothetical protein [Frankiales bacterium]
MNDFASALSAALHDEAKEIAMSADMLDAEHRLHDSMRSAKRHRRIWTIALATAALLVVTTGALVALNRPGSRPSPPVVSPSPTASAVTFPLDAWQLTPSLTAALPGWAATAQAVAASPDGYTYQQQLCDGPCPNGQDRGVWIFDVPYMYPLGATRITTPTYAQYVTAWEQVQSRGYGTVDAVTSTSVDGKPATTMIVEVAQDAPGLVRCGAATDRKQEGGCFNLSSGQTLYLAIVDQGVGQPPTLLYESRSTTNTGDAPAVAEEFATWLATVRFS